MSDEASLLRESQEALESLCEWLEQNRMGSGPFLDLANRLENFNRRGRPTEMERSPLVLERPATDKQRTRTIPAGTSCESESADKLRSIAGSSPAPGTILEEPNEQSRQFTNAWLGSCDLCGDSFGTPSLTLVDGGQFLCAKCIRQWNPQPSGNPGQLQPSPPISRQTLTARTY